MGRLICNLGHQRARLAGECTTIAFGLAVLVLGWPAGAAAQSQGAWSNITTHPVPTVNSDPAGITAGPDGALWFSEFLGNKIGRITTAGAITEYPTPTANSGPSGIAAGPDGALWFTEYKPDADKIGRITTTGAITEYPVPKANSGPSGIAAGPDGALWFTEYNANQIGRIDTTGAITEYRVPTAGSGPTGITAGPDDALWFIEYNANQIGHITTGGVITEYRVPTADSAADAITAGPDGALWFTEGDGDKIGRITTAGAITEYPVPTANSFPGAITAGPDGALWFTEVADNIARAPACGLGFSASFANSTLTMNFDLGTSTPATFDIVLLNSTGPFAVPFSKAIPAVVPPQAFTLSWTPFPNLGTIQVRPELGSGPGQGPLRGMGECEYGSIA